MGETYGDNPVRNRKVGLPDPQANGGQATPQSNSVPIAISGPSQMVQQMAQQNYALNNGGQMPITQNTGVQQTPPQNVGVQNNPAVRHPDGTPVAPAQYMGMTPQNRVIGRFEAQRPVIRGGNGMVADGTSGYTPSSTPSFGQSQGGAPIDYPMGDDNQGGQPVVRHPDGRVAATPPANYNENPSVLGDPTKITKKDIATLSDALNAAKSRQASFNADPNKRDGGFFGWLRGLMPKNRPGKRDGETDDEYDARRTRNMQMVATLADAIRHMGNIVNTSKGAPLQIFNDPNAMIQQAAKERKAQRQKDAAAKAEAEKAQNEITLKQQAAEADRKYKEWLMGMKKDAADLNKDKFDYQKDKDKAAADRDERNFGYKKEKDEQQQANWEKQFEFRKQQAAISNNLRQQSINKRSSGGGGRGGRGPTNNYPLYNPNTGQTEYYKNEKSWIARAAELGYDTKTPSSSTTSQEVISKDGVKKVSNTTRGNSVAAQIGKQTAQKKAEAKNKGKSSGGKSKSTNGYKNTKALGL